MDKMNYPRGLIRFSTQNGIAQGWDRPALLKRVMRWRTAIYGGALLIGVTAFAASLMTRAPFRVDIIRDRGVMARMVDDGVIENVYRLHIMNATELPQRYRVDVSAEHGVYGMRVDNAQAIELAPSEHRDVSVRIRLDANAAANLVGQIVPINMSIEQQSSAGQAVKLIERSTFVVPR